VSSEIEEIPTIKHLKLEKTNCNRRSEYIFKSIVDDDAAVSVLNSVEKETTQWLDYI